MKVMTMMTMMIIINNYNNNGLLTILELATPVQITSYEKCAHPTTPIKHNKRLTISYTSTY